jgi:hypothetical protein
MLNVKGTVPKPTEIGRIKENMNYILTITIQKTFFPLDMK